MGIGNKIASMAAKAASAAPKKAAPKAVKPKAAPKAVKPKAAPKAAPKAE